MTPLADAASPASSPSPGTMHFVIPRSYEAIDAARRSPRAPRGGGRQRRRRDRRRRRGRPAPHRAASRRWWLLALLAAVFPANVHMAVNPEQVRGLDLDKFPRWALWARLPLQPLAMLWVWRATRD